MRLCKGGTGILQGRDGFVRILRDEKEKRKAAVPL
jgi:hypothetical protein